MFKHFLLVLLICSTSYADEEKPEFSYAEPDVSSWAIDVAFGIRPYFETVSTLGFVSPKLFGEIGAGKIGFRLNASDFQSNSTTDLSMLSYYLFLELDNPIYNKTLYYFVRLGLRHNTYDEAFYDGDITEIPFQFGVNFIVNSTEHATSTFFIEQSILFALNYEESKSLPGSSAVISKDNMFQHQTNIGLRIHF